MKIWVLPSLEMSRSEVEKTHQFFHCKDGKSCRIGLEAKVVLSRGMSRKGKFAKFTKAFGHLNLEKGKKSHCQGNICFSVS